MSLTTLFVERGTDGHGKMQVPAEGVLLPSGRVVIEWRPESFEPDERTKERPLSIYASVEDCEQATGGTVRLRFDEDTPAGTFQEPDVLEAGADA